MTAGPAGSGREGEARPGRPGGIRHAIGRIGGLGPVRHLGAVLDAYGDAGGGLLAAGLAFGAVFALIPITLLVVAVSGVFVGDPSVRAAVVREVAARVPPLEQFITLALDQLTQGTAGLGLLALLGLAWTGSQFYGQLDGAFALIFRGERRRNLLDKTLRGLVTLVVAVAIFLDLLVVSAVATLDIPVLSSAATAVRVASPIVGFVVVVVGIAVLYRVVPTRRVPWRAAIPPAIAVGLIQIALSTLFVLLAPHLASPRIFGPFVTVFASLAWLSWSFQALLIGAAWVRDLAFGDESILVSHAEASGADDVQSARDGGAAG
ncbi:MAG TPA: YihY/virulence factor BrkB family protein [Candidatus Limnocylindrales bacterium]